MQEYPKRAKKAERAGRSGKPGRQSAFVASGRSGSGGPRWEKNNELGDAPGNVEEVMSRPHRVRPGRATFASEVVARRVEKWHRRTHGLQKVLEDCRLLLLIAALELDLCL